jgi:hypothetical protein
VNFPAGFTSPDPAPDNDFMARFVIFLQRHIFVT